ncbi:MAG: hypothetical protein WCL10_00035 [Novosphingobium sp.]|uniref:hypothetical protein n=1 Tax=Novosphingobium sp. TaxID=1874826 RepID=UPI0030186BCE
MQTGDTVLSGVRVYLRNIVMVPANTVDVASTAFCVLRPGPDLDARFMHRWISSDWFINALIPLQRGNSPPAVLDADVRSQPVPVPPLKVQKRVADRIDSLFAEIDEGEAALAEARAGVETYRKSLLKAAVTGELTADWRAANPQQETGEDLLQRILADRRARWHADRKNARKTYIEPTGPDTDDLPALPEGWVWASVQQLSTLVTSGSRGWSEYYADSGSLFIRAANLNQDRLDLSEVAFVQVPTNSEGARTKVQQDDFLITITGANVTKCGVVTDALADAYVSQHVGLVRPVTAEIGRYLYLWSRAYGGGKQYLEDAAYGAGKPGLNLPNIYEMAVALPSFAEIAEIELRVQHAQDRVPEADFIGSLGSQLRQSILAAAFRGELVA